MSGFATNAGANHLCSISEEDLERDAATGHWPQGDEQTAQLASLVQESGLSQENMDCLVSRLLRGPTLDHTQSGGSIPTPCSRGESLGALVAPGEGGDPGSVRMMPFGMRLSNALPADGISRRLEWGRLAAAAATETLAEPEVPRGGSRRSLVVEVNSGGQVFFALFDPQAPGGQEEAVVIKFCTCRHVLQSEQMAGELAWHLQVPAPRSRLLLRLHDAEEWGELATHAASCCTELSDCLECNDCLLLLQFVPGSNMAKEVCAWSPDRLEASSRAIGRLLVLDMLLANADRLPVMSLSWRGNPSNILWAAPGPRSAGLESSGVDRGTSESGCIPIDAVVARRPPMLFVRDGDKKVGKLLELCLLDRASAYETLLEAVSCNPDAVAAVEQDWAAHGSGTRPLLAGSAVKAFNEGVREALALALQEQGLLEMLVQVVRSWLDAFLTDVSNIVSGRVTRCKSDTRRLSQLTREADGDDRLSNRLAVWQDILREKSLALREAVDSWAERRGVPAVLSFHGFLGHSVLNPIVDAHELVVRLEQLVARARVMGYASAVTRPSDLAPSPLFVGPATSAGCFHYMRTVGIRCVLNCTSDLPEPSEEELGGDIEWHRVAMEDVEEQDIFQSTEEALAVIDRVAADGGKVLVHCHEGRSRSVSLCLAYLVSREGRTLADAFAFVKGRRRESKPNAGFWKQLLALELERLGSNSMDAGSLPRGKPVLSSGLAAKAAAGRAGAAGHSAGDG